jgi:hypothetical protein
MEPLTLTGLSSSSQPLHIAVNNKVTTVVKVLTDGDLQPQALVARNQKAAFPLHIAISEGLPNITRVLLDAARRANLSINAENGMGDSPLELARQLFWIGQTRDAMVMGGLEEPPLIGQGYSIDMPNVQVIDLAVVERRVVEYKAALADLASNRELAHGSPMTRALEEFVSRLDKYAESVRNVSDAKTRQEVWQAKLQGDSPDMSYDTQAQHKGTFAAVQAHAEIASTRQLVRLDEVQGAIQAELDSRQEQAEKLRRDTAKAKEHEGGLLEGAKDDEDDDEEFSGFSEFSVYTYGDN